MTTDSTTRQGRRPRTTRGPAASPGARALVGAGAVGLLVVLAVVGAAALLGGADVALAAAVGGVGALAVFAFGTTVVHVASAMLPAASLLVALLTYSLQLVLMTLLVLVVADTPIGAQEASRRWFAGGLITTTACWLGALVWRATHLRIPAYEAGAR